MSTHKHTPGPWTATQAFFFGHDSLQITGTNGDTSPFLCRLTDDTPDYEANARLIAAAPDLLNLMTAATRLDELTGANLEVYSRTFAALARAAISKATGGVE